METIRTKVIEWGSRIYGGGGGGLDRAENGCKFL